MTVKSTLPQEFTAPHIISGMAKDTPILAGFSGGADSSALLRMLKSYSEKSGAEIFAAHINHGIRGEEADRDERHCRDVCERLGIRLFVLHADLPAIAKERGESLETAARNVRYEFFEKIMTENHIPLLATAHNANDNLETMIFNLCRGASLSGLCGIPETRPCVGGAVIRPILRMSREQILDYCEKNSISFVTDSTNTDTDYTRNMIRAEVIPALRRINSGAVRNSARLSSSLCQDARYLESVKDSFLEELDEKFSVETEKLNGAPDAIASRALVSLYSDICGGSLERVHVEAMRDLSRNATPHSSVTLPDGIEAVIEDGCLCLRKKEEKTKIEHYSLPLYEGSNRISQTNCEIVITNSQNTKNVYKNSIQISLESAKIKGELYARSRLPQDKILMGGMHKSVKKLLCDKKIPLSLRPRLPIICDGDGIVAIPMVGVRDGVRGSTKKISVVIF